ncbi:MAG: ABC transporter permease [Candidatus Sumerlaeota bacterium]|nr:ABC transporter permease [Candidatus Sumerlaeota bacterium]
MANLFAKWLAKPLPRHGRRSIATLSQWQLISRRFSRHRLALVALFFLAALYTIALLAEFFAPYPSLLKNLDYTYSPPQTPRFNFKYGFYTFALRRHVDPITFKKDFFEERDKIVPLRFFPKGEPYHLWGFIPYERRFFGADREAYRRINGTQDAGEATFFLLGADKYGHDIFSRIIYGARISLSVGLVAIAITFLLGVTIGGISGYVGGNTDNLIQRLIEIINAFPQLPLWLALAAAMPGDWPALKIYFAITIVLSLLGWTGLARVVRGKILSLREEDYATAARLMGASHARILFRHLVPGFTSHIIVSLTLTVPGMILGETSLSFLGLGLRPPIVSWGVMLQDCMNMQAVTQYPWLMMPLFFIILAVLCFNFMGDGLRDAADPYSAK